VTGTNGKTTTCALTAHLLRGGGASVGLGGNIGAGLGPPASELALLDPPPDWYVLEMSSFQLADIDTFRPDIGVVTNLAPDHLDRYESVEAYYADKARLFENAADESVWVFNADDPATEELAGDAPGRRFHVSLERSDVSGAVLSGDRLELTAGERAETILTVDELPLLGRHNVANALTAALTAHLAGTLTESMGASLSTFEGLPHRLAPVARAAGVLWVDDSKATNVAAAVSAVRSLSDRPLVVLLGGKDKGEPFGPLLEPLRQAARHVLVYGEAGERLARELGTLPLEHCRGAFEDVVERAGELAREGDTVLLTPACSSFDMFTNYEERGRRFAELARARASRGEP
jgi:UDP-N-acetylmuramoylalanine--D-glutamate ligase